MEQDIPNTNQTRMIKFGDFEPIDVNNVGLLNKMPKVAVGKVKVTNKEDPKLGNPNKMPNVIGAFSSEKVTPILRYATKAKEDKGHSLELQENAAEWFDPPCK
ncbi:hypothetical protein H5410_037030, partial [Solanum commersonii]